MTLAESAPLTLEPICIGPVGLPERTLGWQILGWTREYLLQPDGPRAREPWDATDEQARFILWWYSVEPDGGWTFTEGMLRRMKGWGKDPLGAVLCAVEMVGPCRVGGWDKAGQPIGVPEQAAWIQTAAVSQEQTRNTMTLFPGLFGERPRHEQQGRAIREFGLDIGKTIIYAMGGTRRIEAVTSSPRAVEGARSTFVLKNETQHWVKSNGGLEMAGVISGNTAKITAGAGRSLAIANAHVPGRASDAEADYKRWLDISAGLAPQARFLYDSREAPKVDFRPVGTGAPLDPNDPEGEREFTPEDIERRDELVKAGIRAARGDAVWLDVDRLMVEFYNPKNPPSEFRRKSLNQVNAAEDSWLAPFEWTACAVPGLKLEPGDIITLGLDGSRTTAHTVLVACRVSDSALFPLGVWDPANFAGHEIPRGQVRGAVENARLIYDVVGFYSDVHPFETDIDDWHQTFRETLCVHATDRNYVGWDHRGRLQTLTKAVEAFKTAVLAREISYPAEDTRLDQYIFNAVLVQNSWGWMYDKESEGSSNQVDGADACVMARLARQDYLNLPPERRRQPKRLVLWTPKMKKRKGDDAPTEEAPDA